jgi:hypothetical protein
MKTNRTIPSAMKSTRIVTRIPTTIPTVSNKKESKSDKTFINDPTIRNNRRNRKKNNNV